MQDHPPWLALGIPKTCPQSPRDVASIMSSSDVIFLLDQNGALQRIPYAPYSSEDVLQTLLANHPDLLAGDQIDPEDPPRWLLVTREAGIPDVDVTDRWSADHLLLDQHGVPTFVEVKRSTDTRIRREVVGQMIEYAANATRYWPSDRIRSLAAEQCGGTDQLDQRVRELIGANVTDTVLVERYWRTVDENLRNGPLRLLFVGDELPRELRRLIEFLNEHMPRIEVLGVEVRYYNQGGLRALVPRVIGQTERTREDRSSSAPVKKTTEAEFFEHCPAWSHALFSEILRNARSRGLSVNWGTKGFSIRGLDASGQLVSVLYGYPAGALGNSVPSLEVYLKHLDPMQSQALRKSLRQIVGFIERGQFTIGCVLSEEALIPEVQTGLPHIWNAYGASVRDDKLPI